MITAEQANDMCQIVDSHILPPSPVNKLKEYLCRDTLLTEAGGVELHKINMTENEFLSKRFSFRDMHQFVPFIDLHSHRQNIQQWIGRGMIPSIGRVGLSPNGKHRTGNRKYSYHDFVFIVILIVLSNYHFKVLQASKMAQIILNKRVRSGKHWLKTTYFTFRQGSYDIVISEPEIFLQCEMVILDMLVSRRNRLVLTKSSAPE